MATLRTTRVNYPPRKHLIGIARDKHNTYIARASIFNAIPAMPYTTAMQAYEPRRARTGAYYTLGQARAFVGILKTDGHGDQARELDRLINWASQAARDHLGPIGGNRA